MWLKQTLLLINSGFIIKFSFLIYSALSIFPFLRTWDLQGLGPQLLWLRYICKESEIIFCKNEPWCLIFCISTEKPLVHLSRSAAPIFPYPSPLPALSHSLSLAMKIETESDQVSFTRFSLWPSWLKVSVCLGFTQN